MILIAILAMSLNGAEPPPPAAAPVPPSTTVDGVDVTVKSKRADRDTIVCRSQVETGSLFKRQVCLSKDAWKQKEQQARDFQGRLQQGGNYYGVVPN